MYRYNFLEVEKEINKKLAQEFNNKATDFFTNKIQECEEEQKKILVYIEGIQDLILKVAMKERFINGKNWGEISEIVGYSESRLFGLWEVWRKDPYIKSIINYLM